MLAEERDAGISTLDQTAGYREFNIAETSLGKVERNCHWRIAIDRHLQ